MLCDKTGHVKGSVQTLSSEKVAEINEMENAAVHPVIQVSPFGLGICVPSLKESFLDQALNITTNMASGLGGIS